MRKLINKIKDLVKKVVNFIKTRTTKEAVVKTVKNIAVVSFECIIGLLQGMGVAIIMTVIAYLLMYAIPIIAIFAYTVILFAVAVNLFSVVLNKPSVSRDPNVYIVTP